MSEQGPRGSQRRGKVTPGDAGTLEHGPSLVLSPQPARPRQRGSQCTFLIHRQRAGPRHDGWSKMLSASCSVEKPQGKSVTQSMFDVQGRECKRHLGGCLLAGGKRRMPSLLDAVKCTLSSGPHGLGQLSLLTHAFTASTRLTASLTILAKPASSSEGQSPLTIMGHHSVPVPAPPPPQ